MQHARKAAFSADADTAETNDLFSPQEDAVFDSAGTPLYLSEAAQAFGTEWGGEVFWRVVGQRLAEGRARFYQYLSVAACSGDGACEPLGVIVGYHTTSHGIIAMVCSPHRSRGAPSSTGTATPHGINEGGRTMSLKEVTHHLTDLIWTREQEAEQPVEEPILSYVQDAVNAEIEYRRRMRDLDRRLAELEGIRAATTSS